MRQRKALETDNLALQTMSGGKICAGMPICMSSAVLGAGSGSLMAMRLTRSCSREMQSSWKR